MRKTSLFILATFLSFTAHSAPIVKTAAVTKTGFSIEGSNFGNTNPMVFWDDGTANFKNTKRNLSDVVPSGAKELWNYAGNANSSPITFIKTTPTSPARSNREEVVYYAEGHSAFLMEPHFTAAVYDTLYVSWWYKPGKSPSDEGGANKFIRIWDDTNGVGTRISWQQMLLSCLDAGVNPPAQVVHWAEWNGNIAQWNHHEIYVNLKDKRAVVKVNGQILHDMECMKDPTKNGSPLYVGLIGFDHGSNAYKTQTTSLDDIYIGNTQARAVVSNSATWNNNMNTEVLPIVSWSSSKIETGLISGYLPMDKNLYLYIIDETGSVNANGFLVNCPKCPIMQ